MADLDVLIACLFTAFLFPVNAPFPVTGTVVLSTLVYGVVAYPIMMPAFVIYACLFLMVCGYCFKKVKA